MYSLRRISKDSQKQYTTNNYLGDTYSFVHKDSNLEEYNAIFRHLWGKCPDDACTNEEADRFPCWRAFIRLADSSCIGLCEFDDNYIVMENGRTYEKLNV